MVKGITTANLGLPDYENALRQHDAYLLALARCGLSITLLDALEEYPDSVFVEDTAIVNPNFAIVTNPGSEARNGESKEMEKTLKEYFDTIELILYPGTVDGGDVMQVGTHFYIGLSGRTNSTGADRLIEILGKYGYTGSKVELKKVLHLKTGMSYLENNHLLLSGEFLENPEFQNFSIIRVPSEEAYASNSLRINDHILIPKGFPTVKKEVEKLGHPIIEVDTSEFRKLDGGLSCLSLRY
jgi:dimethylargininase